MTGAMKAIMSAGALLVLACGSGSTGGGGGGNGDGGLDESGDGGGPISTCECDGCERKTIGIGGGQAFDIFADDSEFVAVDGEGALVVDKRNSRYNQFLWVAETDLPGVVKIDLSSFEIVARYRTPGGSTSRTTVNVLGEAFVGSRTDGPNARTGVTKLLPDGENCPDSNSDGVITTSTGRDDVLPWGQDDCVAWHVETEDDIRGLAAHDIPGSDPDGICSGGDDIDVVVPDQHYVWVGGLHGQIYKLDAQTGDVLMQINSPTPVYGMALAGDGKLWIGQQLSYVDIEQCTDEVTCDAAPVCETVCTETDCDGSCDGAMKARLDWNWGYGITVDCKNRVWMSDGNTLRYDPNGPVDNRLAIGPRSGSGGIAADANGWVWAANGATTSRLDAETLEAIDIPAPNKGVAIDSEGRVLTIQNTGVHLIVPGDTLTDYELTNDVTTLEGFAYAYSDMTGVQTRLAADGPGWYSHIFAGCVNEEVTDWRMLEWDVEAPDDTWVMFYARSAATVAELDDAMWLPVASCLKGSGCTDGNSINDQQGNYLEIEVRLTARNELDDGGRGCVYEPGDSARIKRFTVGYACDNIVIL